MSSIVLKVPRIRNGQPATSELHVRYTDDDPKRLPLLTILGRYSQRYAWFKDRDVYRVAEIPAAGGRAFLLYRTRDAIADDGPEADPYYGVFIAYCGQTSDLCECRGHASRGYCKHVDALKALLAADHIDLPEAGRPEESTYQTDPERSGQTFADAPF